MLHRVPWLRIRVKVLLWRFRATRMLKASEPLAGPDVRAKLRELEPPRAG